MTDLSTLYSIYQQHPHICTDSRQLREGDIFFALHGANFDGNDFALKAIEQGAAYSVVDRHDLSHPRCLQVNDTLTALQQLAAHHRQQWGHPLLAITGTNGKTTTKELTRSVLSQRYHVLATEGNLNNHIGVPLMLLRLTSEHQIAVIEMGASAPGEIALLASIAQPTMGVITNVGEAHLEGFGSIEGVLATKSELPEYLYAHGGTFFLNHDDALLLKRWQEHPAVHYGIAHPVPSRIVPEELPFIAIQYGDHTLSSHLVGGYNHYNILAAVAIGRHLDLSMEEITRGIEGYVPTNNRSQLIHRERGLRLIVDAYNANPSSMSAALTTLISTPAPHKVAILGDMLELGKSSLNEHRKVIQLLASYPEVEPILCGPLFTQVATEGLRTFAHVSEVADYLRNHPLHPDTLVLIKGSRGMALERLLEAEGALL